MRTLPLLLCLACCVLPSCALSGPAQDLAARALVLEVECCDLLQAIHKFLVDKPSDRVSLESCRRNGRGCLSYNLIKTFVRHTRSMLDPQQKLADGGVATTDSSLVFSLSNETLDVASMTIFAFMGRSVATDSSMSDVKRWVSYDIRRDELYMQDSACEINRDVYTTLLLASIVILVFFIGVQVRRDDTEKPLKEPGSAAEGATKAQPATVKPRSDLQLVFRNLVKV
jgi:hypothetical protein